MRIIHAIQWEQVGKAFILGERGPDERTLWQGHFKVSWLKTDRFNVGSRFDLSHWVPCCVAEAIVTSVTSASLAIEGDLGARIDFQGIGTLMVDGESVTFL